MGKVTGFLEYDRINESYEPVAERVRNYDEFVITLADAEAKQQGARCMDCGTPFCNNGCPVNNVIPDFNDLVYRGEFGDAVLETFANVGEGQFGAFAFAGLGDAVGDGTVRQQTSDEDFFTLQERHWDSDCNCVRQPAS